MVSNMPHPIHAMSATMQHHFCSFLASNCHSESQTWLLKSRTTIEWSTSCRGNWKWCSQCYNRKVHRNAQSAGIDCESLQAWLEGSTGGDADYWGCNIWIGSIGSLAAWIHGTVTLKNFAMVVVFLKEQGYNIQILMMDICTSTYSEPNVIFTHKNQAEDKIDLIAMIKQHVIHVSTQFHSTRVVSWTILHTTALSACIQNGWCAKQDLWGLVLESPVN